jgi:hypothetical protein
MVIAKGILISSGAAGPGNWFLQKLSFYIVCDAN